MQKKEKNICFVVFTNKDKVKNKDFPISELNKAKVLRSLDLNDSVQVVFEVDKNTSLIFERDDQKIDELIDSLSIYSEEYELRVVLHRTSQEKYYRTLQEEFPLISFTLQSHMAGTFYYDVLPKLLLQELVLPQERMKFFSQTNFLQYELYINADAGRFPSVKPEWLPFEIWQIIECLKAIPRNGSHKKDQVLVLLRELRIKLGM